MSATVTLSRSRFDARWRRAPAPERAQRGFALVEALVSILIFSVGILGLMGLEARAINFSADAEDRNRAALFASDVSSSMWLAGSVTIDNTTVPTLAQWQAKVAASTQTGLPLGTLSVTPVAGTTNAADIVITWQSPQAATPSKLTTRIILP